MAEFYVQQQLWCLALGLMHIVHQNNIAAPWYWPATCRSTVMLVQLDRCLGEVQHDSRQPRSTQAISHAWHISTNSLKPAALNQGISCSKVSLYPVPRSLFQTVHCLLMLRAVLKGVPVSKSYWLVDSLMTSGWPWVLMSC